MPSSEDHKKKQSFQSIEPHVRQGLSEKKHVELEKKHVEAILKEFLPQIKLVSKTIMKNIKIPPSFLLDDLESFGLEGLLKAIKKFNKEKRANFKTYAMIRIRGEILDAIRKEWRYRAGGQNYKSFKEKLNKRLENFLDESDAASYQDLLNCSGMMYLLSMDENCYFTEKKMLNKMRDLSDDFEEKESGSMLWKVVETLPKQEIEIIRLFYQYNLTQQEIADRLKVSQSKICRLHGKILLKLKKSLEEHTVSLK